MSTLATLLKNMSVRYILVGIVSFLVENCVFLITYYALSAEVKIANLCSIAVALMVNFTLNKYYVFNNSSKKHRTSKQLLFYILLVMFNATFTTFTIKFLIDNSVPGFVAKPLTTGIIVLWTYFAYSKVIFKKIEPSSADN